MQQGLVNFLLIAIISISGSFIQPCYGQFSEKQEAKIDSLTKVLTEEHHDTVLARVYYELSDILYVIDLDTITDLCNKALDIVDKNLAVELSDAEKLCFLEIKANCYNNIGYVHKSHGDIPIALEYYHDALLINEELKNGAGRANLLNNIAVIYESQEDIDAAVDYYGKALVLFKLIENKKGVAATLNNLGRIHGGIEDNNEKALAYYEESLEIRKEIEDKYGVANSKNNIGYVYLRLRDTSKALVYFNESLSIREELRYKPGIVNSLINIGRVHLAQGNLEMALENGQRALIISKTEGFAKDIRSAALLLKELFEVQGKTTEELEMFELYVEMRDSLENQRNKTAVYKQQLQYEYQKQKELDKKEIEKQLAIADEKKERQRIVVIIISVCLVVFLVLSLVLFNRWRLTKKQKRIIEFQNAALAKRNQEKEYMMREMHHRVKNNLQIVNSLLRFQSREVSDAKVVQMFEDSQNRILSMALVHEHMYRSKNLMEIDADSHLRILASEIIKDYSIDRNITLNCDIEKVTIGIKTLIPLGLIVNEIVSNAVKHAFSGRDEGGVYVSLKKIAEQKFELLVGDDGIGCTEVDLSQKEDSLGLELVQVFTEQLDGTIEQLDTPGTHYKIIFSDQD